jgi:hypothetical protein
MSPEKAIGRMAIAPILNKRHADRPHARSICHLSPGCGRQALGESLVEFVAPSLHCLIGAQQRLRRTIVDENGGSARRSRVMLSAVPSQAIFMADDNATLSQAARRRAG